MKKQNNNNDAMEKEGSNTSQNNQKNNLNQNQHHQNPIIKLDPKAIELLQKNFEKKFQQIHVNIIMKFFIFLQDIYREN